MEKKYKWKSKVETMNRKKEKREGNRKYEGNETRGMNRFGESTNNEIDTNETNEIKIKKSWKWNVQCKNTIGLNKQIRRVYEKLERTRVNPLNK